MRTRRETIGVAQPQSTVPQAAAQLVPTGETVLPTQQQRAMGQLKTAMLNLNKRHGSSTTNEVLNQIIQALSFTDEDKAAALANHKPEYTDVVCDVELANPPVPPMSPPAPRANVAGNNHRLRPVPKWLSFDEVSVLEKEYFGPLFSMDEERWKIYLSLRNDVVRIYEDMLAQCSSSEEKSRLFVSSSDLRQRLHPKDDAAYIFELWKVLTDIGVINRGRIDDSSMAVAKGDGIVKSTEHPVPAVIADGSKISSSTFTRINCSACGRECRFFCYKPLAPPPETPEAVLAPLTATEEETNPPLDFSDEAQSAMKEEEETPSSAVETYMCHDCTPAFFEKIPLRLFIDQDTKDRIVRGEFEEVGKDDLKSFLVIPGPDKESLVTSIKMEEDRSGIQSLLKRLVGGLVPQWDQYMSGNSDNNTNAAAANPLDILDASMQEALSGAGQKIRGSVLIEQQVRNMVYGASLQNDEVQPVCPTTIDRAFSLVEEIFKRVSVRIDQPLPASVLSSPIFVLAKKTHQTHFELLCLVWRTATVAKELKEELLMRFDGNRVESLAKERLSVKRQYVEHLKHLHVDTDMEVSDNPVGPDLFIPVTIDRTVKLASTNPAQLRLVAL